MRTRSMRGMNLRYTMLLQLLACLAFVQAGEVKLSIFCSKLVNGKKDFYLPEQPMPADPTEYRGKWRKLEL